MSFAGTAGAAGAILPVATLRHPLGVLTLDGNGNIVVTGSSPGPQPGYRAGGPTGQPDGLVRTLFIDIFGDALTVFVDGTFTGAAADTGILVTSNPAATTAHGIPLNFGAGRGQWGQEERDRLNVELVSWEMGGVAADAGAPYIHAVEAAGLNPDVQIIIKNLSSQGNLAQLRLKLHYQSHEEI